MGNDENRVVSLSLGPSLSRAFRLSLSPYDEREKSLLREVIADRINETSRRCYVVHSAYKGPFSAMIDCDGEYVSINFQEQGSGKDHIVELDASKLMKFVGRYWNNIEPFVSDPPVGDLRRWFERARHDLHGLAANILSAGLDEKGFCLSRDFSEDAFALLAFTCSDSRRRNPFPDAALGMIRATEKFRQRNP